jgi:hypothetical protein
VRIVRSPARKLVFFIMPGQCDGLPKKWRREWTSVIRSFPDGPFLGLGFDMKIWSVIRESTSQSPTDGSWQGESIKEVAVRKFDIILDLVIQDLGVLELVDSGQS